MRFHGIVCSCVFSIESRMFVGSSWFIAQELLLESPSHGPEAHVIPAAISWVFRFSHHFVSWATQIVAHSSWHDHEMITTWSSPGRQFYLGKRSWCLGCPSPAVIHPGRSRPEVCVRSSWPWINCCRRCMRRCCPRAQRKLERGRSVPGWLIPTLEGGGCELENGYGSIPINTIFSGMNIHLPAILMFTRGTRFWHTATSENDDHSVTQVCLAREMMSFFWLRYPSWGTTFGKGMI